MIGVASELCGVHPQTLRQYERLGLVTPARVSTKNRLYSEQDIDRVRRIKRLTQDMGSNLAGVEIILKLLDEMEELRTDFERQFDEYVREAESKMQQYLANSNAPIRRDQRLLPVPKIRVRKSTKL
ncbi:MAG: MerR family transcriptional regulator [Armatimonadetes bacterium]|nr:MerR family transcriptional regulator [Armatimonadota bacterium]